MLSKYFKNNLSPIIFSRLAHKTEPQTQRVSKGPLAAFFFVFIAISIISENNKLDKFREVKNTETPKKNPPPPPQPPKFDI